MYSDNILITLLYYTPDSLETYVGLSYDEQIDPSKHAKHEGTIIIADYVVQFDHKCTHNCLHTKLELQCCVGFGYERLQLNILLPSFQLRLRFGALFLLRILT